MIRQNASLPHTGIATFAKAAYVPDLRDLDADVAILGVPYDGMASMRPGCSKLRALCAMRPPDLGNYYLSIDIDGLDPSIAPGTERPEAEGLTFTEAKQFLRSIAARGRMVDLDLVEVNPYLDYAELTQHIAVQIIIEAIATRFAE